MPAGRKTKYTPDRVKRIIDALAAGNTRRAACTYGGIDEATFFMWLHQPAKIEFTEAVKHAESSAEVRHVANIAKAAADGNWTASAWWLERRFPKDWGRVDRVELVIREQAERLALAEGLDYAELIAEAERIVAAPA